MIGGALRLRNPFQSRVLINIGKNRACNPHGVVSAKIAGNRGLYFSANAFDKTTNDELVMATIDESSSVATMTLKRPPVNSLSLEMCQAISSTLKKIENDHPNIQGLVITSSNPKIFSAGLAIEELYRPTPTRLSQFWTSFQQVFLDLYSTRLATIAAIEGHAIAGGCMLTMACDYRIMSQSPTSSDQQQQQPPRSPVTIGLNETKLGIAAPSWMVDLMIRTVGFREAEMALCLGRLYEPESAMTVGLVDKLVPVEDVVRSAVEEAALWARISPRARVESKINARGKYIEEMERKRKEDLDNFCDFVQDVKVQENLGLYVKSLKSKKGS